MEKPDDGNVFVDLSGTSAASSGNPYDALIEASNNDPKQVQERYDNHRVARNEQQRAKLLSPDFTGFIIDPILEKLLYSKDYPGYVDPRNCLVFWGRPPRRIRDLVGDIQRRLLETAPSLWTMPPDNLHLTIMEMAHSRTPSEILAMLDIMRTEIPNICEYVFSHPVRLVKPLLSYDGAAVALSFLPAAGEPLSVEIQYQDSYTYHHLRRDISELCKKTGVEVASRYVLPSAHLTIARFVNQDLFHEKSIPALIKTLETINKELQEELWAAPEGNGSLAGQWIIGEERSLDCRTMTVWYGGGESEYVSEGTHLV